MCGAIVAITPSMFRSTSLFQKRRTSIALAFEEACPFCVVVGGFGVLAAIDFDDQLCRDASRSRA